MSTPQSPVDQSSVDQIAKETFEDSRTLFLTHPLGLFLLFMVEMWERFSYYGMRGLLVLYLITVLAANQLKPGTYSNQINFTQVGATESENISTSKTFTVAVGSGSNKLDGAKPEAATGFKIQPLKKVKTVKDGTETESWELDPAGSAAGPFVAKGEGKAFDVSEWAFRISNPTDKPIKVRLEVLRDPSDHTYFTINKNPSGFALDLKPDKERKADEAPFDAVVSLNTHDSGRNWSKSDASVLYGWYTGLAYLFPILGGILADKLIGTHRSMLIGGLLISAGHIVLGISGFGELAFNKMGMTTFVLGLALIVLGTGHFKPTVSVMVGQLYKAGDPRRDGAFTIFYMGINLGAFLCAFVCGTLGQKVGWHWGFGSAAVGMLAGLGFYLFGRPFLLKGIGDAPKTEPNPTGKATMLMIVSLVLSALFAAAYHFGAMAQLGAMMDKISSSPSLSVAIPTVMAVGVLAWAVWFVMSNRPEDRGPVITIFVFMIFNAFFWIAFEQAGSSINVFTEQNTELKLGGFEVPATWFQSVNAGLIFILAPLFAALWTVLGRKKMNPSQPVKIALGLIFLGLGYIFMVWAGSIASTGARASMMFVIMTYFWHTVGELCLSPTGLSYVTKAAPVRFVALLMGIWFVSSFIANLGGGLIAAKVEAIEQGKITLPWHFGGQADYFFLFVISSIGAGIVILILTPLLKKLMRSPID